MEIKGQLVAENIVVLSPGADSLDAGNAKAFRKAVALIIEERSRIVLDLSAVSFVDSSGLGALIACQRLMNTRAGELRLCSISENVRALFELMRMQRVFKVFDSREEALRSFS